MSTEKAAVTQSTGESKSTEGRFNEKLLRVSISGESDEVAHSSFDHEDSESDAVGTGSANSFHDETMIRRRNSYEELNDNQVAGLNFAMEHRIFLNAILGLLMERDKKATQIGMNDPNVLKCGPLKKASHLVSGVWKQKYCEIRRGMFSYYEDTASENKSERSFQRKNVPLEYGACTCRAVKIHRKGLNITPGGAIFEIKLGNTRRLWLARSRAERQAWIQAIHDAIVGGSVTRGGDANAEHAGNSKSPYKQDLKRYQKVSSTIKNATNKQEYLSCLRELHGENLDIPVQWMMSRAERSNPEQTGIFHEDSLDGGVEQLRKDLLRDTLKINDELFQGDSGHASEKIIAGLARCILETGKTSGIARKLAIPESKAFMFSRDVLLSSNRTRSGGDSYFCVDTLVNNANLVVAVPSSRQVEPVSISVELDEDENTSAMSSPNKSGWALTRHSLQKSWRKRYFVLSEGTLSFYRNATPRPHGLRGQVVVSDATVTVDRLKDDPNQVIITVTTKDGLKIRSLCFQTQDKILSWVYALECTARRPPSSLNSGIHLLRRRMSPNKSAQAPKAEDGVTWSSVIEEAVKEHGRQLGYDDDSVDKLIAVLALQANSAIKLCIKATTEYNVCTTDPQGDDDDTWATIGSTFMQTFRISEGKLERGEEIVRLLVPKCADPQDCANALENQPAATTTRLFKRSNKS